MEHVELTGEIGTDGCARRMPSPRLLASVGAINGSSYASRAEMVSEQVRRALETAACDDHCARFKVSLPGRTAHVHTGDRAVAVGAERYRFCLVVDLRIRQSFDASANLFTRVTPPRTGMPRPPPVLRLANGCSK